MEPRGDRVAVGGPGADLEGESSRKDGFGTAYSADSRLWFTIWNGLLTEVHYPTIDRPRLRQLELLISDGESFLHEEAAHLPATVERPHEHALGYVVKRQACDGAYAVEKELIAAPHHPVVLLRTRIRARTRGLARRLKVYAFATPLLGPNELGNDGYVVDLAGAPVLMALGSESSIAIGSSSPFARASVGYIGRSDGRTDLLDHLGMTQEYDRAPAGQIGMIGEAPLDRRGTFTLGIAFGRTPDSALTSLAQALGSSFEWHRERFVMQWNRITHHERDLAEASGDGGRLYRASHSVLLAHEDKSYPGAFVASPSTPWGATRGADRGGYHLVWTRDLVHTATALLALGSHEASRRALIYLASRQRRDGGFPQNFWIDGRPYWEGIQLDEVAHPILLAARLERARVLGAFDPYTLVMRAARYLIALGPATPEDRWEEVSGYSPSTLAVTIAALTAAAEFARARRSTATAEFIQEYADFLEAHVERWTVTDHGTLDPEIRRHYVRVRPIDLSRARIEEGSDFGSLTLPNLSPYDRAEFPAVEIVSPDFLELVRHGVRRADDPTVVASVTLVDRTLRRDTPRGPVWLRYTHDGYGESADGAPFTGTGLGHGWPLLTGERAHYELAAGRDVRPYRNALERFASGTGLLPEQIWDLPDVPDRDLWLGQPTGSATPLAWTHAEYVRLLRSIEDHGVIFDQLPGVARRYLAKDRRSTPREIWKFNRQPEVIAPDESLRIIARAEFRLHWSADDWRSVEDTPSTPTELGLSYVDLPPLGPPGASYRFTFYWPESDRWEGKDFEIRSSAPGSPSAA